MYRGKLLLLLLCLALQSVARAQVVIDFDTDSQGNPILPDTLIAEQYAGWGAHFVPDVFGGNDAYGNSYLTGTVLGVTNSDFSPNLTSNVQGNLLYRFNDWFNSTGSMNFWVQFDRPVGRVSVDLYMDHSLFNPDGQLAAAIYGFDSDLGLVDFVYGPGTGETAHLELLNPTNVDLYYIGFEGNWNVWTGFDNLSVTFAPEPGALALLLVGIIPGAVSARIRRRRRSGQVAGPEAKTGTHR